MVSTPAAGRRVPVGERIESLAKRLSAGEQLLQLDLSGAGLKPEHWERQGGRKAAAVRPGIDIKE